MDEFFARFRQEPRPGFTKSTVSAWRVALEGLGLGSVSINVRITAVRKLAVEAADIQAPKGNRTPVHRCDAGARHGLAGRLLLHVLGAAVEFERALILERTQAGSLRYQEDFSSGNLRKTVHGRSGRNLPPHRPRRIFSRDGVIEFQRLGLSIRQIAKKLGLGLGAVARTLQEGSKRS